MAEQKTMKPGKIQIQLTAEQTEQVRHATGKEVEILELAPEQLEERVAPCLQCT